MVDSAAQPMRIAQDLEPADEESDSLILFLIADFLARSSSCQRAAQVLTEELVSARDNLHWHCISTVAIRCSTHSYTQRIFEFPCATLASLLSFDT
jgi:hypothetical protein